MRGFSAVADATVNLNLNYVHVDYSQLQHHPGGPASTLATQSPIYSGGN